MAIPPLTALPAPPLATDTEAVFNAKADATLLAEKVFVDQMNATTIPGVNQAVADTLAAMNAAAISAGSAGNSVTQAGLKVIAAAEQVALATTQAGNAAASATSAQTAAAAAGAAAGLPSLSGNSKKVLTVKSDESGVEWKATGQVVGDILLSASPPSTNYLQSRTIYSQSVYAALFGKLGASVNLELSDVQLKTTTFGAVGMVYGNGKFLAADGSQNVRYSTDGIAWTVVASPPWGSNSVSSVSFANGKFFVLPTSTTNSYISTDGINWTLFNIDTATTHQFIGVFYAYGLYMVFAASETYYATSTNGTTWTARTLPVNSIWTAFVSGTSIGALFSSTVNYLTTADGINWTARTVPIAGGAGKNSSIFAYGSFYLTVTVSIGGALLLKSDDGINWQIVSLPESDAWTRILFIAGKIVAFTNQTGLIAISQDGINWFRKTSLWMSATTGLVSNGTVIIVFSGAVGTQGYWLIYPYDPATQFATPLIPAPAGLKAYIKYQE